MNAPMTQTELRLGLSSLALLALRAETAEAAETAWLDHLRQSLTLPLSEAWQGWLAAPPAQDRLLHSVAARHGFGRAEMVATALACATQIDPMVARLLQSLQRPVGGAHPLLGLTARAAALLGNDAVLDLLPHLAQLYNGPARRLGVLDITGGAGVLVESSLRVAPPLAFALSGISTDWPDVQLPPMPEVPLGPSVEADMVRLARGLHDGGVVQIRTAWPQDAFSAARHLANHLGLAWTHLPLSLPPGLGLWLDLTRRLPVFLVELAPGETRELAPIVGYSGPVVVISGMDGGLSWARSPLLQYRLPLPPPAERGALWRAHGMAVGLAEQLGRQHRLSASRIHTLAQASAKADRLTGKAERDVHSVADVARGSAALDLGAMAQLLPDLVDDGALVLPPALRASLEQLLARCRLRDGLVDGLGVALTTRYRPGVRALFTGVSGTGKTLSVAWLASRLGLPLYRVDLSAVVSKYIGETEKNLAQLFARAEAAELVLLFDEADALFGKRTDVKDANDRFANQQTNYLLQRIETFDGLAVLTSNSRARFDGAFTRRLDMIIEFPSPNAQERRDLWLAHLGSAHSLDMEQLNRMATCCDLPGGHIRSASLMAAGLAGGQPIDYGMLRLAIAAEYTKLGRMPPAGL
jgi:ATPase family associated with various cellular activities (AAA)